LEIGVPNLGPLNADLNAEQDKVGSFP